MVTAASLSNPTFHTCHGKFALSTGESLARFIAHLAAIVFYFLPRLAPIARVFHDVLLDIYSFV